MIVNLTDSWQLASKLTLKRIKNAYRIYSSYTKARSGHLINVAGLPISMSIEPTTSCNLRCPECPSGLRSFTRPTGKINLDTYNRLLDEIGDYLMYLILYFQGEPYLNAHLFEMIDIANKKNIYTATSTNGHFLSEENARKTVQSGLNRLIISIDGSTQQTYEAYRRSGSLEKVLEGTRNILQAKKELKSTTPHVIWQFLVVRPNEHEIPSIKALAKKTGVNQVAFKSAQIYDYEQGNDLIPLNEKYSRYKQVGINKWALKNNLSSECWKMWHSAVMTWDGKIVPCCFDKDAQHEMGNINQMTFEEIWNSKNYQDFRNTLFHARDQIEMCKNCTEGGKIWV